MAADFSCNVKVQVQKFSGGEEVRLAVDSDGEGIHGGGAFYLQGDGVSANLDPQATYRLDLVKVDAKPVA